MMNRIQLGGYDTPPPGEEFCDFCGSQGNVEWSFPCRTDFEIGTALVVNRVAIHIDNIGWWASCDECCKIIKRADRQALAERSVDFHLSQPDAVQLPRERLVNAVREAQDSFWANREGGEPITAEEYRKRFLDKVPGHESTGEK